MSEAAAHHPKQQGLSDTVSFGFWLYLMTDLIVFSVLFASFVVLRNNTHAGPSGAELFDMPYVLIETMLLLFSSFTIGLAVLAVHAGKVRQAWLWLVATLLLGAGFLGMELYEFHHLITEGHDWHASAFLSAYFTLVGTHGIHIAAGLLWLTIILIYMAFRGLNMNAIRKLTLLAVFWHFLDVVWIFIFTVVYLLGIS